MKNLFKRLSTFAGDYSGVCNAAHHMNCLTVLHGHGGCIRKGGTRPIVEVLKQAEHPTKQGAIVMDTAGYDISSVTSMVAAGCNAVIFTTGRGTPTGNPIVPVLKVTANARTYEKMEDNMDVDLSAIIKGTKTYQECGKELVSVIGS